MTLAKQSQITRLFRQLMPAFLAACVIVTVQRGRAYAGGYEWGGLGSRAQSMGGAFIGKSDDWTAIYWNPAGLTRLEGSGGGFEFLSAHPMIQDGSSMSNLLAGSMETRYQIDTFAQYVGIEPTRFSRETVEYDFYFPSGAGGYWQMGEWSVGAGFYTPVGYYLDWDDNIAYGAGSISASLFQELSIKVGNVSLAREVGDGFSVGAGVNLLMGGINYEAKKVVAGSGISDYQWGYESDCDGYGAEGVFGIMKQVSEKVSVGAVYRTGGTINLKGDAGTYLSLTSLTERSDFRQKFHHPSTYGMGLAYQARPNLAFTGDWQRTNWSEFRVDVDYKTEGLALVDKDYSADWRNSNRYRFGVEYVPSPKWALRGGYFFDQSPVPGKGTSFSNIAAVDRHNITLGVGHEVRKNVRLDLVYAYAWGHRRVDGVHYRQRVNSVGLSMSCAF
ncbi:MAG: outer membrane protein transport protein [Sedimentisphaerales bacterium]|nr:outer membrane protein transport protein [Sedimentisphaerales bacterium]